jgi:tetratricopeptide (TPR) repeat protein
MNTTVGTDRDPSKPAPGAGPALKAAAGLLVAAFALGLGLFAATLAFGAPGLKAAFHCRRSINRTLSATLRSQGLKAAVRQYEQLKSTEPAAWDFDERELSLMGRRLVRERRFEEGLRFLHLNAEAYPRSTRVYERLGNAYLEEGDTALAIANYRKSLQMDPENRGPARMLAKLDASRR